MEDAHKLSKALSFLPLAEVMQHRSKDVNTQVGAVVLDGDFNVRITGYNGPPRGVKDLEQRLSRPHKYPWMGHAEENVVAQAARVGVSLRGCTLLVTALYPCSTCARLIIQAGINVVLAPDVEMSERWATEWVVSQQMFQEAGVRVYAYDPEGTGTSRRVI